MKHSTDRILTTHCGSLARPKDLLDVMKAKVNGEPHDEGAYRSRVRSAVNEIVRRQVDSGIDVVTDGAQGKLGFSLMCASGLLASRPSRRRPAVGSSGRRRWRCFRSTTKAISAGA